MRCYLAPCFHRDVKSFPHLFQSMSRDIAQFETIRKQISKDIIMWEKEVAVTERRRPWNLPRKIMQALQKHTNRSLWKEWDKNSRGKQMESRRQEPSARSRHLSLWSFCSWFLSLIFLRLLIAFSDEPWHLEVMGRGELLLLHELFLVINFSNAWCDPFWN